MKIKNSNEKRIPFRRSLQFRLIFYFLLVSLVPLGVVITVSTIRSQQTVQDQIVSSQRQLLNNEKGMIVNWVNGVKANLDTVATSEGSFSGCFWIADCCGLVSASSRSVTWWFSAKRGPLPVTIRSGRLPGGRLGQRHLVLGSCRFGEGRFLLNTFPVLANLDVHPAADRMFLNMISYAAGFLAGSPARLPADFETQLKSIGYLE